VTATVLSGGVAVGCNGSVSTLAVALYSELFGTEAVPVADVVEHVADVA